MNPESQENNEHPPQSSSLKIFEVIVAIVVLFVIAFLVWNNAKNDVTESDTAVNANPEIVFIIDDSENTRKFKGVFKEETRVWDLLQQATAFGNIALEAHSEFIPSRIDGHKNSSFGKWELYINGELQDTPPFETMAKSGDTVMYKYLWLDKSMGDTIDQTDSI
jgi:hypothetical protein